MSDGLDLNELELIVLPSEDGVDVDMEVGGKPGSRMKLEDLLLSGFEFLPGEPGEAARFHAVLIRVALLLQEGYPEVPRTIPWPESLSPQTLGPIVSVRKDEEER